MTNNSDLAVFLTDYQHPEIMPSLVHILFSSSFLIQYECAGVTLSVFIRHIGQRRHNSTHS
jgi:hypothetical protein